MTDVSLVYAFAAFNFPYEFSGKLVGGNALPQREPRLIPDRLHSRRPQSHGLPYSTTAPAILHDHNHGSPSAN
jgi:hypothetical protein